MKKFLIVDDDEALCALARDYLRDFAFEVTAVYNGPAALKALDARHYAAAIVDVMMPQMDGFALVRRIRAGGHTLPLLMLSARGEVSDRVVGLETGADDYLPKPFEPRELAARLTALCRRAPALTAGAALAFADLRLIPRIQNAEVKQGNTWLNAALTVGEYRALSVLVSARPSVVTRDELSLHLRGIESDPSDRSLDITISRVRQKLGDSAQQPKFIKTLRTAGYAFIAADVPPDDTGA